MAENSKINWTTHTFNPWIGCTKVSPGCLHCYAETLMDTRYGRVKWGAGNPRSRTAPSNWKKVRSWNNHARRDGVRPRVFCASLADWLDDEVPAQWLADLLSLIHYTPNLDWLLLTKRPQNWKARLETTGGCDFDSDFSNPSGMIGEWLRGRAPENVWVGTTVEDQTRAAERIPHLLAIPAGVRFLSCEPLLGPVDINAVQVPGTLNWSALGADGIDWVICGGESGRGARSMADVWADDLRSQCQAAGVAFWMKQMGGATNSRHELADIPESLRVRELPVAA